MLCYAGISEKGPLQGLRSRVLMVDPGGQFYHIHRYLRLKKHTPSVCGRVSRKDGQVGQVGSVLRTSSNFPWAVGPDEEKSR